MLILLSQLIYVKKSESKGCMAFLPLSQNSIKNIIMQIISL